MMKLNELCEVLGIYNHEALTKYRGVYTYRVGFFYTHGKDHHKIRENLEASLKKAGIEYRIIDSGEQWKAFRGGDTLKQGSHWWVKFSIIEDK